MRELFHPDLKNVTLPTVLHAVSDRRICVDGRCRLLSLRREELDERFVGLPTAIPEMEEGHA